MGSKITVESIMGMKGKKKIVAVTAYDYTTARICDRAGVDIILVGDSAAMVMLGYKSTTPISMEEMLVFCKAVSRAREHAMVVADMPFMSYQISMEDALYNACRFIKEGNADAVKVEGGREFKHVVEAIVDAGIPVMGHIGLKPQTAPLWHGYKVQGKVVDDASRLIEDAVAIEEAGAFSIVLEQVTYEVAEMISSRLSIPTIGIGSGSSCDGQVLVLHDMLGLYEYSPRFVKRYADLSSIIAEALTRYRDDVLNARFPGEEHTFHMDAKEYERLKATSIAMDAMRSERKNQEQKGGGERGEESINK
ncbi:MULTISPECIES: 3-methyl-2-oxobutanoate hydroxymethyltransferase [Candidatus Nitrosocaldus]|jgi:3-methyl-2-oxobutanoate hydroxymethyltransferase|uniref:3-methyl-2-oxobutanoate hydroxymethyltransferase n=1 Tax=Candidatus Nitrosocaldus cavascurensis TaxID=2058097 RepID=A0A2K5ANK7_9ARCH|nr:MULTISPECIES: 3-methyl-2-oxobutanoate hydroxymethyltransferase [Candidatus Nitrosocaldus]SPC33223.1 3-methyl-2-oxobutanoate hydroxymethyltransferase [Candidatus Nitrosocaldus cavascurensis]